MLGDSPLVTYYRQAKHYSSPNGPITRVVIHDMEYPETPQGAEWCADFFAGSDAPQASAHYCVDSNSVAQCVREVDRAWHAPPNYGSIGVEHAGYMSQSRAEWLDDYSQKELKLSAKLVADICKRHSLPVVKLSAQELRDGKHGICGHVDVSNAWHETDHGDPGPNFPWDTYLKWVNEAMEGDWLDMASEDDVRRIIREELEKVVGKPYVTGGTVLKALYRGYKDNAGNQQYNEEIHDVFLDTQAIRKKLEGTP